MPKALGVAVALAALWIAVPPHAAAATEDHGTPEKRGCCSRHRGVCGCSDSHVTLCCDGSASPTCGC